MCALSFHSINHSYRRTLQWKLHNPPITSFTNPCPAPFVIFCCARCTIWIHSVGRPCRRLLAQGLLQRSRFFSRAMPLLHVLTTSPSTMNERKATAPSRQCVRGSVVSLPVVFVVEQERQHSGGPRIVQSANIRLCHFRRGGHEGKQLCAHRQGF